MRLLASIVGGLVGAVIRKRTRCPGHVPHPMVRPATCRHCWEVME